MTAKDVGDALGRLGLSSRRAAKLLGCKHHNVRRWKNGTLQVPEDVANFLTCLTADNVSEEQAISALRDIEKAIESVGEDPSQLHYADIMRAAAIMLHEGYDASDAFQLAYARSLIDSGLPKDKVEKFYGPETAKAILEEDYWQRSREVMVNIVKLQD